METEKLAKIGIFRESVGKPGKPKISGNLKIPKKNRKVPRNQVTGNPGIQQFLNKPNMEVDDERRRVQKAVKLDRLLLPMRNFTIINSTISWKISVSF